MPQVIVIRCSHEVRELPGHTCRRFSLAVFKTRESLTPSTLIIHNPVKVIIFGVRFESQRRNFDWIFADVQAGHWIEESIVLGGVVLLLVVLKQL